MKNTNLLLPAPRRLRIIDDACCGSALQLPLQQPSTRRRMEFRFSFPQGPVPRSCPARPLKRRLNSERISDMAYSQNSKPAQKSFLRRLVGSMCFASLSGSQKQFLGPLLLIQRRRKARSYKRLP
jgi:hypothetical protein